VDAIMVEVPAQLKPEIEKYEQKHAENPEGRNFVPLANAYRKAGELALAERLLRTGLARHPGYLSAHIVLGRTLADRGEFAGAAAEFRRVLEIDPQNLIALRTLGDLALDARRIDEAEYWYRELLVVDPMNEEARRALVEVEAAAPLHDDEAETAWQQDEAGSELSLDVAAAEPEPAADAGTSDPHEEPALTGRWQRPNQEPEGGLDSVDLASETLAELYARQGFADQAAEMYRVLIRRRGEEPALVRRLAELEGREAEVGPSPADDAESEPSPADLPPWLEALNFDEPDPAAAQAEERHAWTEPPADEAVMDSGAEAFVDSFRFGFEGEEAGTEEAVPLPDADPAALPADSPGEEMAMAGAGEAVDRGDSAPTAAEYFASLLAWRPGSADASPPYGAAAAASGEPRPAAPVPAEDDLFPWELPAEAAAPSTSGEEEFQDGSPLAQPDPALEPRAEQRPPEAAPAAPPPPEVRGGERPAPGPRTDEDDDDLESFQAWLRSLKR
jgi:tetratricopeptide (TPR) repeat protein